MLTVCATSAACFIASATTAGGFASFATSGALAFLHFGAIAAFGVMAALGLCFTLLPVCLVWTPHSGAGGRRMAAPCGRRRGRRGLRPPAWRGAACWRWWSTAPSVAAPRAGGTLVLCGFAAVGLAKLRVEVDVYHLFGEETRVVRWIRFVEEHLRKPDTLDVVLTLPEHQPLARSRCSPCSRASRASSPYCPGSAGAFGARIRCAG